MTMFLRKHKRISIPLNILLHPMIFFFFMCMLINYIVGPVAIIERAQEQKEACLFLSFCVAGKPTLSSWLDYINIVRWFSSLYLIKFYLITHLKNIYFKKINYIKAQKQRRLLERSGYYRGCSFVFEIREGVKNFVKNTKKKSKEGCKFEIWAPDYLKTWRFTVLLSVLD